MNKFRVALLQIASSGNDIISNQAKGIEYCRKAADQGADIALFPEMWSIGYSNNSDRSPNDMSLILAGEGEGIYLAEFDIQALRFYREHTVWGNAFRRPGRYTSLTDPAVAEPFKRSKATR